MPDADPHVVAPGAEGRHAPEAEALRTESPYLGVTWWTMMIVREGRPLAASVAYDLPVPSEGFALAADGYRVDAGAVRPLVEFHVRADVAAVLHDDPADV